MAAGQSGAQENLLSLVYDQLRTLARHRLLTNPNSNLQATELVHEAWLRLGGAGGAAGIQNGKVPQNQKPGSSRGDEKPGGTNARENSAKSPAWENRRHFFGAAALAMRHILVEHARRSGSEKRGGGLPLLEIGSILDLAADPEPEIILALDEALETLRATFPQEAEVVMFRFFAGLSVAETAAALEISVRQVERHWQFARAWLYDAIQQ